MDIKDWGEGSIPSCVSSVTPASPHPSSKWGQTGGSRAPSQSSPPTLPDFHVLIPCSCSHRTPTTCRNGEALQMMDYVPLFSEPFGSWKSCFKNSITHNFSRNLKSKFYLLFLSFWYRRFFRPSSCLPSPAASFLWGPYRRPPPSSVTPTARAQSCCGLCHLGSTHGLLLPGAHHELFFCQQECLICPSGLWLSFPFTGFLHVADYVDRERERCIPHFLAFEHLPMKKKRAHPSIPPSSSQV